MCFECSETFAIYISIGTEYQTTPKLKEIELSPEPLLCSKEISEYKWSTHQIKFPHATHERMIERGDLLHKLFVIVAYRQRIYWGKFMDDLDSSGCQNPVIKLIPRHPDGRNTTPDTFVIERAYPGYFGSENDPDIRNNQQIYKALSDLGVLAD